MEIVLLERVAKLGDVGSVVNVKNGFARNFLLPRGKALRATPANLQAFEERKVEIEAENAKKREEAEKISKKLEGFVVTLIRQASDDGRLYGSVTARDIAAIVATKDSNVTHQHVRLNDAIKSTGIYVIDLQLHGDVAQKVRINIARSESEAREALAAAEKAARGEKSDAKAEAAAPAEAASTEENAAEASSEDKTEGADKAA